MREIVSWFSTVNLQFYGLTSKMNLVYGSEVFR